MSRQAAKQDAAIAFIQRTLASGPLPSTQFFALAESAGINRFTLEKAKRNTTTTFQKDRLHWVTLIPTDEAKQIPLFGQATIPSWLSAAEAINWAEHDPLCRENLAVNRLVAICQKALDAHVVVFENLIDDTFTAIEALEKNQQAVSHEEFVRALKARVESLFDAGPDTEERHESFGTE